jgi:hypothetical protein
MVHSDQENLWGSYRLLEVYYSEEEINGMTTANKTVQDIYAHRQNVYRPHYSDHNSLISRTSI